MSLDDMTADLIRNAVKEITGLTELLELRTAALNRVTAQLDEVRKLHKPCGHKHESVGGPICHVCVDVYPCETARAAGIGGES